MPDYSQLTGSNLWVPSSALPPMMPEREINALVKAAESDPALAKKLGAMFSMYYSIWTNMVSYGAAEKPRQTASHRFLRECARQSFIDKAIINTRVFQLRHVSQPVIVEGKQKGYNVRHLRHSDPNYSVTKDVIERADVVEQMINHPNPEVHPGGLDDVFTKLVKGMLTIDRVCMVILRDRQGRPINYHLLPPDDIKPRFEVMLSFQKRWGTTNADATANRIFAEFGVDVSNAAYVQELEGVVYGAWSKDEMSILITNPSDEVNRYGFGESCLELSLEMTTLLLMALNFNKQAFLTNWPEAFLVIQGNYDPTGLQTFKNQIYQEIGKAGEQRLPVLSTGNEQIKAELLRLRDSMRDMQFLQLLRFAIALKCAAFRMHPSEVNFAPDTGGQRPILAQETQETQISMAQEEGFRSILDSIARWFTRVLIQPWYDDLEMVFSIEDQPTPDQQQAIWTAKLQNGYTVDEYRAADGAPPLTKVAELPGNFSPNPAYMQLVGFKQQQNMMQQQMQVAQQGGWPQGSEDEGFAGMERPGVGEPRSRPQTSPAEAKPVRKSMHITVRQDDDDEEDESL